MQVKLE